MKYYAVKKGNKTGIFLTWDEAKEAIKDFQGAEYKSFFLEDEAKAYLEGREIRPNLDKPTAYIDGSFDEASGCYSFGCVFFYNGKEMHFKKSFPSDDLSPMRNVAGEIKGAGFIIQYCMNRNIKDLVIYHDYMGISEWYNGTWKAREPGTIKYQEFANKAKLEINVTFNHVKGHSNNKYNDLADKLAKEALGIK